MKSIRIMLPLLLVLAAVTVAQMGPPPVAEQMKKFEPMLGNWEGSGTVHMAAGGDAMPWTSKSTCQKILGGHFVLEDMTIYMGPDSPPMLFRNVYTWDRVTERYMALKSGNDGTWALVPMFWTADNKVVDCYTTIRHGKVETNRWVSVIGDGEMSFKGWNSVEGGKPFLHVEGAMKRGGDGYQVTAASAKQALAPPAQQLDAVAVMLGDWKFAGEMVPAPGAPKMKISGHEKIYKILGGHTICFDVVGDPTEGAPDYRGLAFVGWDPQQKCVTNIGFSSFGDFHSSRWYPQEDRRVLMFAMGEYMGTPMVGASVMEWPEDRSTLKFWSDSMMMGKPAARTFEGTFTRVQAEGAAPPK